MINEKIDKAIELAEVIEDDYLITTLQEIKGMIQQDDDYGILIDTPDENLFFKKNCGYFAMTRSGVYDGPYCMTCYENKGKRIHVNESKCVEWSVEYHCDSILDYAWYNRYDCPVCKNYWHDYKITNKDKELMEKKVPIAKVYYDKKIERDKNIKY